MCGSRASQYAPVDLVRLPVNLQPCCAAKSASTPQTVNLQCIMAMHPHHVGGSTPVLGFGEVCNQHITALQHVTVNQPDVGTCTQRHEVASPCCICVAAVLRSAESVSQTFLAEEIPPAVDSSSLQQSKHSLPGYLLPIRRDLEVAEVPISLSGRSPK